MFERIKNKLHKAMRVLMAAAFFFSASPKKLSANELLPPAEKPGREVSNELVVDKGWGYTEQLEKILAEKDYEENMKEVIRDVFREIDENYDKYAAVEEGTGSKKQYMDKLLHILQERCKEAILVEEHDEGSEEDKRLKQADALGLASLIENKIIVRDREDKELRTKTALHELVHLSQEGFHVNNEIPYRSSIMNLLMEADATNNGKYAIKPVFGKFGKVSLFNRVNNTYVEFVNPYSSYPEFLNIYKKLEYLVGEKFMEDWKSDSNTEKDYFREMEYLVDSKYGKGTFKPIFYNLIKIAGFIDNRQIMPILEEEKKEEIENSLLSNRQYYEQQLNRMQPREIFIKEVKATIDFLNNSITKNNEILNNENLLQQKYKERIIEQENLIKYDEEELERLKNNEKRERYLEELRSQLTNSNTPFEKKMVEEKIEILTNPEKRKNYIEILEKSLNFSKEFYNTFSIEKFKKELIEMNVYNENECKRLMKYYDEEYYISEMERLKRAIDLHNVALEGINENLPDLLISFEQKIIDCMKKDIERISNKQQAIDMSKKWHHYKKQFLLEVYSEQDNGIVQHVFNTEELERNLIEKLDRYQVFPRYFENEDFNRYAKGALLDSNVYDISRAYIKTAQIGDKGIMVIYNNKGEIHNVYTFTRENGSEKIYDSLNGSHLDIMEILPEIESSKIVWSQKMLSMNKDDISVKKVRKEGELCHVR